MSVKPFQELLFVSFGSGPEWNFARWRLQKSLKKYFRFSNAFVVNQKWLFDTSLYKENIDFFQENPRGFGLWAWKPLLIKDAIAKFPSSKTIVYLDMGCDLNINKQSLGRLAEYLNIAESNNGMAFELNLKESDWTSSNVLEYFKAEESQRNQVSASILIFSNNSDVKLFLENWFRLLTMDNFYLTKGNPDVEFKNSGPFHRHDQSVLSLFWHLSAMPTIPDETYLDVNLVFDHTKPFWTSRNREFFKSSSPALLRLMSRIVRRIYNALKRAK